MLDFLCNSTQWFLNSSTSPAPSRLWAIPHVIECVHNTVLTTLPCIFFFAFLPVVLYSLHTSKNGPLRVASPITFRIASTLLAQQLVGAIILIRFGVFDVVSSTTTNNEKFQIAPLFVLYVTLGVAWFIWLASRNRGLLTSGVLFNFWLLLGICGAPSFYYRLTILVDQLREHGTISIENLCFVAYYSLVLLTFLSCCFVDRPVYREKNENICPEYQTSFLNQITFFWFSRITSLGYRRALTMEDLWELPEDQRSKHLFDRFNDIWIPYIQDYYRVFFEFTNKRRKKTVLQVANSISEIQKLVPKNKTENGSNFIDDELGNKAVMPISQNDMPRLESDSSEGVVFERRRWPVNRFKCVSKACRSQLQPRCDSKSDVAKTQSFPSVIWPLFLMFKWFLIGGAFYKLIFDLLQFVAPHLLKHLIDFVQDSNRPMWMGVSLALAMFAIALLQSMIVHQYFHYMFCLGMYVRAVLTSAVYKKALMLSASARRSRTIGEIVNLMSIDIQRFQDITAFMMLFWSSPLQVIMATFFLYRLLGISVLAGVLFLCALLPFNFFVSKKLQKYQVKQMCYKDERMKILSEMLNGIKILKLYAWEASIQKTILDIRKRERGVLRKLALVNALMALTWSCAPFVVAVLTFGIYVTIDPVNNVLTPQITFVGLALFNILRFPLAIFAMIVNMFSQCIVGYRRLTSFLAAEEINPNNVILLDAYEHNDKVDEHVISFKNASFSWNCEAGSEILSDISLDIKKGELIAIVGRVGSGKSSFLSAILGEIYRLNGTVTVRGRIAYVAQQPWIQNMRLAENILFGRDINVPRYAQVLDGCALHIDLNSLPAGDQTEIGEKGINLSGGQRQRVSIARAVYADADVYLLDDPLSAVDAHVGRHIFDHVIDGQITELGTFEELMRGDSAFSEILEEFLLDEAKKSFFADNKNGKNDEMSEVLADLERFAPEKKQKIIRQISTASSASIPVSRSPSTPPNEPIGSQKSTKHTSQNAKVLLINSDVENGVIQKSLSTNVTDESKPNVAKSVLINNETVEMGHVRFSVYFNYFRAIGLSITILFLTIFALSSVLGVASNLWLADWSDHAIEIQKHVNHSSETHMRLLIYTSLGMGQAIFVTLASVLITFGMVGAGIFLHERMLRTVMQAPMSFFDVTPIGRILNRFGKDMDFVDSRLPATLVNCIGTALQSIATLAVPLIVTPLVGIPIVVVLSIYIYITRYYINTSRQLKRLDSTTRSPIFAYFQESIQGASSIRAFGMTTRFLADAQRRVDYNLKANYPSLIANRWLAIRLELVGNFIVLCAALFTAIFRDDVTAGLAGLSVSYALGITQTLNWAVRMSSELEANIIAVERIEEYSCIPGEANNETPAEINFNDEWPSSGKIEFEEVELRYRPELNPVLQGVSARIRSCEKIGIIGRTGAGKSSLTLALFRLVEPCSGRIVIDDLDIARLSLHDLRSRMTIVPQDPVLFSGTLRKNLDPFDKHSDDDIANAIQLTYLSDLVAKLPNGLKHQISEGGENISLGQRQLICLARAVLRRSRILVLDEAAASVDVETDQLIQRTIREQFVACTVLTIAHRLQSIMQSDRIMVFERGQLVEFDTPAALLARPESLFSSLAADAGIMSSDFPNHNS